MATKKQRKRLQKERRHEYETVWVDGEGNELEEPPDDGPAPSRERTSDAKKPEQKRPQRRASRATRVPLPPSWRRAIKRGLMFGAVIVALFSILNSKGGTNGFVSALLLGILYAALFIPFTYYVDRFAYRRWERNQPAKPAKR